MAVKSKRSKKTIPLDIEQIKELLEQDKLPPAIGELILEKVSESLEEHAALRRKTQHGQTKEEIGRESKLSKEEIELRTALHGLVLSHQDKFLKLSCSSATAEKIRASGHYWDNKLTYSSPLKNKTQMTIFDLLEKPETRQNVEQVDYEVNAIGIDLTPGENKLMTALIKLLHDKSENKDLTSEHFYSGNFRPPIFVSDYGGSGEDVKAPLLKIKPTELYQAYLDESEYSGNDIKIVKSLIDSLAHKKFIIRYLKKKIVVKGGKKEQRTDLIEIFQPLIKILKYTPDLTPAQVASLDSANGSSQIEQKGEYIIGLHPILIDQIKTKYVEFPRDIEKRTVSAAGGPNKVTESDIALRDYFLRELSNKRYTCEVNVDKLPFILKLNKYIEHRRRKTIQEKIEKAIQVSTNLGILKLVETKKGKQGQLKMTFHLNPSFG